VGFSQKAAAWPLAGAAMRGTIFTLKMVTHFFSSLPSPLTCSLFLNYEQPVHNANMILPLTIWFWGGNSSSKNRTNLHKILFIFNDSTNQSDFSPVTKKKCSVCTNTEFYKNSQFLNILKNFFPMWIQLNFEGQGHFVTHHPPNSFCWGGDILF